MKKILVLGCLLSLGVTFFSCTKEQVDEVLNNTTPGLTNDEVIAGLKQALNVGTDTSVTVLNKLDGYFKDEAVKILLPPEAQVMYSNLSKVPGISTLMDQTILAMNRAAEDAASEAKPIFVNAITSITIADGFTILNGTDSAATTYLRGKTYDSLYHKFQPKIDVSLNKPLVAGVSAQSAYSNLISVYNTASLGGLLFAEVTTNSLSSHVTNKGLNGLFLKVSDQEKKIRKDPLAQVTDLLKKVFGPK
ncbi:MAG: DUF4197 domain-containing protein [Bacteroidota bacterium]